MEKVLNSFHSLSALRYSSLANFSIILSRYLYPPVNSNDKLNVGTAVLYLKDNVSNCIGMAEAILFFYFFFQSSSTGCVTRKNYNSSQLCRKFLQIGQLGRHSLQRGGFLID